MRIDVYHHFDGDVLSEIRRITQLQEQIMTTQAELAEQLLGVRDQVNKVKDEVTAKIAELEDAITNAGDVSPEVEAALAALKSSVQSVDDIVPDSAPQA